MNYPSDIITKHINNQVSFKYLTCFSRHTIVPCA